MIYPSGKCKYQAKTKEILTEHKRSDYEGMKYPIIITFKLGRSKNTDFRHLFVTRGI